MAGKGLTDMSKRGNGYGSENRVNILKKVKIGKKWNLYPAVVEPNGKLRDKVRVRGKVELHPEGYYYIEWWQDGRKREQIKERAEVVDRARRKALELEANRAGIETVQEIGSGKGLTVAEAVASYLKDMEPPQREPKTYVAYKYCLELFASTCAKRLIQDVKREDVLSFIRKLYELGCGPRTAYNRAVIVSQLLKANGITKLLHNRDWPEYVEPIRSDVRGRRNSGAPESVRQRRTRSLSLLSSDWPSRQRNASPDLARHRLPHSGDSRNQKTAVWVQTQEQRGARSPRACVVDRCAQEIQRLKETQRGCVGLSERVGPARQTARVQTEAHRLPRENELRTMRIEAREQMLGGTVLFEFLPAQIPAHVCDAQSARSRLRHQDAAELDGTQRPCVHDGLPEGSAK